MKKRTRKCGHKGCKRKHWAKGYCSLHWRRWKLGFPMDAPLRRKQHTVIKRIWKGGYVMLVYPGRIFKLEHRVKMEEKLGRPLKRHEEIHHKNGDRADNRLGNLELWSHSQPPGQRVKDKVKWAKEILKLYS